MTGTTPILSCGWAPLLRLGIACGLAAAMPLLGAEPAERTLAFSIPAHGEWTVTVPAGVHIQLPADGAPAAEVIRFTPDSGHAWKMSLACVPIKAGGLLTDAQIRNEFVRVSKAFAFLSVEKKCTAEEIRGGVGRGYFSRFTDASLVGVEPLGADSYRQLITAVYAVGNHVLFITFCEKDADVLNEDRLFKIITSIQQD
jgi:hypothetical protein